MKNKDTKFKEELQISDMKKDKGSNKIDNESLMKKIGDNARKALEILKDEEGRE